jgi:hypothetical protein
MSGARRSVAVERLGMELWQKQRVRSTGANLDLQGPHLGRCASDNVAFLARGLMRKKRKKKKKKIFTRDRDIVIDSGSVSCV